MSVQLPLPIYSPHLLASTEWLRWTFEHLPIAVIAPALGLICAAATWFWVRQAFFDCGLEPRSAPGWYAMCGGFTAAAFTVAMLNWHVQQTPEVQPTELWRFYRIPYHLTLIVGLLAAAATDIRACYISNRVLYVGTAMGMVFAAVSGDLQMVHVWVDWNQEIPQLRGPYLPEWMSRHPHLHGLVWSAVGAVAGMAVTAAVRLAGKWVLGKPALGSGDVYLMGMIGAYVGWQAALVAFLVAPLYAVLIGAAVKVFTNRPALPYGPFLAAGGLTVLAGWRWIWMLEVQLSSAANGEDRTASFALRRLFGDPVALLLVAGIAVVAFVALLGLIRLYRLIPVGGRATGSGADP